MVFFCKDEHFVYQHSYISKDCAWFYVFLIYSASWPILKESLISMKWIKWINDFICRGNASEIYESVSPDLEKSRFFCSTIFYIVFQFHRFLLLFLNLLFLFSFSSIFEVFSQTSIPSRCLCLFQWVFHNLIDQRSETRIYWIVNNNVQKNSIFLFQIQEKLLI